MPAIAEETTKETTLLRVVSTPIASAAISSSRIAIRVLPKEDRTMRETRVLCEGDRLDVFQAIVGG